MHSRTGTEAEAINRLTVGVQPTVMRAILVQCLAGEVAPSAAITRMLAEGAPHTVRAAIDDVTRRAATISRASDMLVHDRVDELTQIFVEHVAALADVSDATKSPLRQDAPTQESQGVNRHIDLDNG
jgi:wyosine [tRNA(Phe)-imidazoG37] synthetase (radical SAM superfamily)